MTLSDKLHSVAHQDIYRRLVRINCLGGKKNNSNKSVGNHNCTTTDTMLSQPAGKQKIIYTLKRNKKVKIPTKFV